MYQFYKIVFPTALHPNDAIVRTQGYMQYVAVIDNDDRWACYEAPSNWQDERAANDGELVNKARALELFPEFAEMQLPYKEHHGKQLPAKAGIFVPDATQLTR